MRFPSALLVLLSTVVVVVTSQNVRLVETGEVFNADVGFTVANVDDFFVDFECTGDGTTILWFRQSPKFLFLTTPLNLRMTSYSTSPPGLARIYRDFIQNEDNPQVGVTLTCVIDNTPTQNVGLRPVSNLFFNDETFPSIISRTSDIQSTCSSLLPQLPTFTSIPNIQTDHAYCLYKTARGSFRSSSIPFTPPIPPTPSFTVNPINITAFPINNITRGAFSCIVYPGNVVESITWYFSPANSSVGEPGPVNITDPGVGVETIGGSSVLMLNDVAVEREGEYYCRATLGGDGGVLTSDSGYLQLGETPGTEGIILAPPAVLIVQEGHAILIPCVGSSSPIFSGESPAVTRGNSSSFGLTISSTDRRDYGTIVCEVGIAPSVQSTLSVIAPIRFEQKLPEEEEKFINTDNSPLVLTCEISGNPLPSISFLFNGNLTSPRVTITPTTPTCSVCVRQELRIEDPEPGDTGVYQCLGQVEKDETTTIVSSSYFNLQYLGNPVISYNGVVVGEEGLVLNINELDTEFNLTCSVGAHPIPSFSWSRNDTFAGSSVQIVTGFRETAGSVLTVSVESLVETVLFTCTASLMGVTEQIAVTISIPREFPEIATPPNDVIAVDQDLVTFTCQATGLPTPSISWRGFPSLPASAVISSTPPGMSTLQFTATLGVNMTLVQCLADNGLGSGAESTNASLIIAGPPGVPANIMITPGQRSAEIQWTSPFSLVNLTNFTISTTPSSSSSSSSSASSITPTEPLNRLTISSLTPFTDYTLTLVSISRAGDSTTSTSFTTLEAAPDSPPINIVAEAVDTTRIHLQWEPPPMETRNGIIKRYNLTFYPEATPNITSSLNFTETEGFVIGLSPGTSYRFSVAAVTVATGVSSGTLAQNTYSNPPAPPQNPPQVPTNAIITTTTIPVNLPEMDTTQFSHFWVVAVKLDETDPPYLEESPVVQFSSNQSFQLYSEDISFNTPYIVSEMSADGYQLATSRQFVLGDENGTRTNNNFPDQYRNGPLAVGTRYTVFVWGFVPVISSNSDIVARQVEEGSRQYVVYTSSNFSTPTSTRSPTDDGLGAAAIAGIVVGALIAFVLLPLVVVMVIIICNMWYRRAKDIGPPPSRHGSKRFKEAKVLTTIMTNQNPRPDSALQNHTPDDVRLPVPLKSFPEHVKKLHANSDHPFSEEYQLINIKSPGLPHLQGSSACNVMKNRYANINAYDETRVHLSFIPGMEGSDFINANYIESHHKKSLFIAAQGPLPNTVYDFWRMVWEEESCCIIMLTNINEKGRVKCHQYWPETGSLGLEDITVSVIDTQQLAYYTIRTFRVIKGTERREVKQFHYTGWPDFGVPDHPYPVLAFIRRLNNFKRTTPGPDIIHCSAGVGRTGTLITIQSMIHMIESDEKVDIFNFILGMRRQRSYMVQTEKQYIFIHDAVVELIRMGSTEVSTQNLRRSLKDLQAQDPHSESSKLEDEYLRLNGLVETDKSMFSYALNPLNQPKNRDQSIIPLDMYRVRLIMAPGFSCSDYINASYVDGYQHRHQYILTQGPMQSTVDDFWRMMWEHNVSCILMLCDTEEREKEMCVQYWTKDKLKQHGDLFVELTQETNYNHYTMREFSLTNTKINESRVLKHYQYTEWTEEDVPPNSAGVVDLIGVLQKTQHQNGGGPIVLHDSTPIGRAGTFCVLSSVLEQLKVEGVVNIFFYIHALRQQQPGLVATYEQYKFCYSTVLEFLDSFHLYSNFD